MKVYLPSKVWGEHSLFDITSSLTPSVFHQWLINYIPVKDFVHSLIQIFLIGPAFNGVRVNCQVDSAVF
jgi:hypothetical protein